MSTPEPVSAPPTKTPSTPPRKKLTGEDLVVIVSCIVVVITMIAGTLHLVKSLAG